MVSRNTPASTHGENAATWMWNTHTPIATPASERSTVAASPPIAMPDRIAMREQGAAK